MTERNPKLTLHPLAMYQIEVPGALDNTGSDWVSGLTSTTAIDYDGQR